MNSLISASLQKKKVTLRFEKYKHDAEDFVREVIGAIPQDWQAKVLRGLNGDTIRNAVKSCHGPGKTALDAWVILWWMSTRKYARVPCTAPTAHQLDDKLWPELKQWLDDSRGELGRDMLWTKTRLVNRQYPDRWFATARVAQVRRGGPMEAEAPGMQGSHADHLLFIIDESSGVHDATWGAVEGALSTNTEVKVLATGNPNCPVGWFFKAFHKHRAKWNLYTVSFKDSPNVSDEWAKDMIEMYGIDHPWVRVKALGEFPTEVDGGLIPLWAWERATDPSKHAELMEKFGKSSRRCLGIDVADQGEDRTVFAFATGPVVHELKKFAKLDTVAIVKKAVEHIEEFKPEIIVIDGDGGYGAGVVSMLKAKKYKNIISWRANSTPKKPKQFLNVRAELSWALRMALTEGRAAIPDDEQASIQATTIRYVEMEDGRTKIMSKELMKSKFGLKSPDEWDAITYALVPALVSPSILVPAHLPKPKRDGRRLGRNHLIS